MTVPIKKTVVVDIPELNKWRTVLGWSNHTLAMQSDVSERTIERLYQTGTTGRSTYSRILSAIQKACVKRHVEIGLSPGEAEIPSSLELGNVVLMDEEERLLSPGDTLVEIAISSEGLEITIDGDLESLTPERKDEILKHIQDVLESPSPPAAVRFRSGSIKITVLLPPDQAERLKWQVKAGRLKYLGILNAESTYDVQPRKESNVCDKQGDSDSSGASHS